MAQDQTPADEAVRSSGTFNVYFSSQGYKVTIESKSGAVSFLEVPQGVMLNVEGLTDENPSVMKQEGLPRTFRGDLVIRTRRADEVAVDDSLLSSSIMAKAPLEMRVKGGVVIIERIGALEEESEGSR